MIKNFNLISISGSFPLLISEIYSVFPFLHIENKNLQIFIDLLKICFHVMFLFVFSDDNQIILYLVSVQAQQLSLVLLDPVLVLEGFKRVSTAAGEPRRSAAGCRRDEDEGRSSSCCVRRSSARRLQSAASPTRLHLHHSSSSSRPSSSKI